MKWGDMMTNNESNNKIEAITAIKKAEEILKGVRKPSNGPAKGRLTKTRLRKLYQLAGETDVYEAFKLRFLYLIARNTHSRMKELEKFAERAIRVFKDLNYNMSSIRQVLEYAVMEYAAREVGFNVQ